MFWWLEYFEESDNIGVSNFLKDINFLEDLLLAEIIFHITLIYCFNGHLFAGKLMYSKCYLSESPLTNPLNEFIVFKGGRRYSFVLLYEGFVVLNQFITFLHDLLIVNNWRVICHFILARGSLSLIRVYSHFRGLSGSLLSGTDSSGRSLWFYNGFRLDLNVIGLLHFLGSVSLLDELPVRTSTPTHILLLDLTLFSLTQEDGFLMARSGSWGLHIWD